MKRNGEHQSAEWVVDIQHQLDDSVDSLDGQTLSALNQARQRALGQRRSGFTARRLAWLGSTATAAIALSLWLSWPMPQEPTLVEDLELITAADLDFYRELEFYDWLADESESS